MTDSNEALPAAAVNQPSPGQKKPQKKSFSWLLILLIVLLATFTLTASIYFWQSLQQQKTVISHINSQKSSDQQRLQSLEKVLGQRMTALERERQSHQALLTRLDKQSLFNTQQLTEMGANSRADWLLAEAEYLLHLANQRLMLEHDIQSTEAILISADKVLSEVNDPGLLPVREALNNEILSLQRLPRLDRDGTYMKLAAMINSLDQLSENELQVRPDQTLNTSFPDAPIDDNNASTSEKLWHEVWQDLKKVVTISTLDEPAMPLLAPEQIYYLKQNLRLMLEQASLALLERNDAMFKHSINQASLWIGSYFHTQDQQAKALLTTLSELGELSVSYEKPDISKSLRLLKTKIEAMYLNHSLGKLSNTVRDAQNSDKQESGQ